ncbi:unnamed protein product [Arctogadus glacialis]
MEQHGGEVVSRLLRVAQDGNIMSSCRTPDLPGLPGRSKHQMEAELSSSNSSTRSTRHGGPADTPVTFTAT